MPKGWSSFVHPHIHGRCTVNGGGVGHPPDSTVHWCRPILCNKVETVPLNYELPEEFSKPGAPELSTFWGAHQLVLKNHLS